MTTSIYIKYNQTRFADALLREAQGLKLLKWQVEGCAIGIPEIISVDEKMLQLSKIPAASWPDTGWRQLGEGLAHIHGRCYDYVGLAHDNYIGLNPQPNGIWHNWGEFFINNRLEYQTSLIRDQKLRNCCAGLIRSRKAPLTTFLNTHIKQASLLHGDLWSGNALCDNFGRPWLIDPAVYIGDPEVDIAMTEMFGGFARSFYEAYQSKRPLTPHYQTKKIIYNLYHYLNHFNLFGDTYLPACISGLEWLEHFQP